MDRYEYKVVPLQRMTASEMEKELRLWGHQGWKLCTIRQSILDFDKYVFARSKEEDDAE